MQKIRWHGPVAQQQDEPQQPAEQQGRRVQWHGPVIDNEPEGIGARSSEALEKGAKQTLQSLRMSRFVMAGDEDPAQLAADLERSIRERSARGRVMTRGQYETRRAIGEFDDSEGFVDSVVEGAQAVGTALRHADDTLVGTVEQAPNMVPSLVGAGVGAAGGAKVGALGGPKGAAAGAAVGAYAGMAGGTAITELGAEVEETILERLGEQNLPPTAGNIAALLSDPAFMSMARARGLKKGVTIAAIDAATMKLSGLIATRPNRVAAQRRDDLAGVEPEDVVSEVRPSLANQVAHSGAAAAVDVVGEGAGEAASQYVARGEVSKGEALEEGIYGLGSAAVDTTIGALLERMPAPDRQWTEALNQSGQINPNLITVLADTAMRAGDQAGPEGVGLIAAVDGADDAELQRVSPRYANLRQTLSEAAAKAALRTELEYIAWSDAEQAQRERRRGPEPQQGGDGERARAADEPAIVGGALPMPGEPGAVISPAADSVAVDTSSDGKQANGGNGRLPGDDASGGQSLRRIGEDRETIEGAQSPEEVATNDDLQADRSLPDPAAGRAGNGGADDGGSRGAVDAGAQDAPPRQETGPGGPAVDGAERVARGLRPALPFRDAPDQPRAALGDDERAPDADAGQEFALEQQTEASRRADEDREQQRQQELEAEGERAEQIRRSEAEADSFTLSGSEAEADQARAAGQSDIFDALAQEAATSPANDRPEPTPAQIEAGNYRKGHAALQGLQLSIENPRGSTRRGVDAGGRAWAVEMRDHYGYIRGTKGRDKEHIDVFVGDSPESERAWVIDQVDPETGEFDEHKVMLGYRNRAEAREAYRRNYAPGWRGMGAITEVSVPDLRKWLEKPRRAPMARRTAAQRMDDKRLSLGDYRADLERMSREGGWLSEGGHIIRDPRTDDVTGRTPWVPRAEWFPDVQRAARLPNNRHGKATQEAAEKALDGRPMTAAEREHVAHMLDYITELEEAATAAGLSPPDPFGMAADIASAEYDDEATPYSPEDYALVERAEELDPDAFETAAKQYENDSAGFLRALQEIVDGQQSDGRQPAALEAGRPDGDPRAEAGAAPGELRPTAAGPAPSPGGSREGGREARDAGQRRETEPGLGRDRQAEPQEEVAEPRGVAAAPDGGEARAQEPLAARFPLDLVEKSYAHVSSSGRYMAASDRDEFLSEVEKYRTRLEPLAETPQQRALLDELAEKFADDYLGWTRRLADSRSGVVSSHIAGRSKFNSRQAQRRGNALDRTVSSFLNWLRAARLDGEHALRKIRTPEQRSRDADRANMEAFKSARAEVLSSIDAVREIDRGELPGMDRSLFSQSAARKLRGLVDSNKGDWARRILTEIRDTDDGGRKAFTARHGIWKQVGVDPDPPTPPGEASRDEGADPSPTENADGPQPEAGQAEGAAAQKRRRRRATIDTEESFALIHEEVRYGGISATKFKDAFSSLIENGEAIRADLNKMTKAQLLSRLGPMGRARYKNERKATIVGVVLEAMHETFALGREYGPRSFMHGQYDDYQQKKAEALRALVDGTTDEMLQQHAAENAERFAETKARVEQFKQAVSDPKTVDDYRDYRRYMLGEGKTDRELRLSLPADRRAEFDRSLAEQSRRARADRKEQQQTTVSTAGETVGAEIVETKHARDGHDLFVVKLEDRVSREDFQTLRQSAKRMGGYYSRFRGNGAVPGFQFRERHQAEAFAALAGGDATQAQQAAKERRSVYEDDRSQSAVQRLRAMAERLQGDADEALSADRKQNTSRRAAMAARAEERARTQQALAETMTRIADAIEDGRAEFLDRLREKGQVELLENQLRLAHATEAFEKSENYGKQLEFQAAPMTPDTADFAEWPRFGGYRSHLAELARELVQIDGTKALGQKLLKGADDVSKAYERWAKTQLHKVSLATADGAPARFSSKAAAEGAIRRSNMRGKAIVLQVKRGQNAVVLSPSEAIGRGLWKGDGDARLVLSDELGMALAEKIGRAQRRGRSIVGGWQFENVASTRKALSRMGIETAEEFRAALREFQALRQAPAKADRVRELERSMVGRKNDGLDFFPTPAGVADEMVQTAELTAEMTVLEPSAGWGHIAERIRAAGVEPDVVEFSPERRELLEAKGFAVLEVNDFLMLGGGPSQEVKDALAEVQDDLDKANAAYVEESNSPRGADRTKLRRLKEKADDLAARRAELKKSANRARDFYTYGDTFRDPHGNEGIMRGLGGMGSDRVRIVTAEGREIYNNRSDLTPVRKNNGSGYDRIVMNPPFSDGRDIDHVRHAFSLLKPGGRIVAIMGEGAFYRSDAKAAAFREWLETVEGTSEKLDEGTFLDPSLPVTTGVHARMVVVDKPTALETRTEGGGSNVFRRFDLGDSPATPEQAYSDAVALTGIDIGLAVEPYADSAAADVPAYFDPDKRVIRVNTAVARTRSEAAMDMAEEILHAVDSLSGKPVYRTISSGSTLLAKGGGVRREVEAHYAGDGELAAWVRYPIGSLDLSESRTKAELFARLGVLYFGDPDHMRASLPKAYEVFDGSFLFLTENPLGESRVLRQVRERGLQQGAAPVRVRIPPRPDGAGRQDGGSPGGRPASGGLDALRRRIAERLVAPRRGGVVQFSRRPVSAPQRGDEKRLDLRGLRRLLSEQFGAETIEGLVRNGVLTIVDTADRLPPSLGVPHDTNAEGLYLEGEVFLIASNIAPARAGAVLLHEVGEHYGLRTVLGEKGYTALLKEVRAYYKSGSRAFTTAWHRVREEEPGLAEESDAFAQEVLARVGETASGHKLSIWRRLVAAVKAWLIKTLGFAKGITDDDVRAFVVSSLRRAAGGPARHMGAGLIMRASRQPAIWYSQMARYLADNLPRRGPGKMVAQMVRAFLSRAEFQGVDAEAAPLVQWLEGQETVTREEVLDFLESTEQQMFSRRRLTAFENDAPGATGAASVAARATQSVPTPNRGDLGAGAREDRATTGESRQAGRPNPDIRYSRPPKGDGKHSPEFEAEAWRKAGMPPDDRGPLARALDAMRAHGERVREEFIDQFTTGMFDRFRPIKDAEGAVTPERSGYIAARLSTGSESVLYGMLMHGAPQLRDGIIQKKEGSRGLLQILQPVAQDLNRWAAWMVGMRAYRLAGQQRENNLTLPEIAYLRGLAGDQRDAFEAVATDLRAYMTDVLQLMADSGLLDQAAVAKFSEDRYYLPFYRVQEDPGRDRSFDPEAVVRPFKKRGLSHQDSGIKRLRGGRLAINDPIENLFAHLSRAVDASMKNHALGMVVANVWPQLALPTEGDRKRVIRLMQDGKPVQFTVADPVLFEALSAVGEQPNRGFAIDTMRGARRLLTTLVTAEPAFMVRNFMRDALHAWLIDKNSFTLGVDSVRGAAATLRTLRSHVGDNEDAADPRVVSMMFAGASFIGGYTYGGDPAKNAAALRKALRRKGMPATKVEQYIKTLVGTPAQMMSLYLEVGEALENANRVGTMQSALDAGASMKHAVFESKDFMDFSLRGKWAVVQWLADTVPFINARLQGLYKLGREARRDPKVMALINRRMALYGSMVGLASIALVASNSGEDWYEELPEWDKDANWHVKVGGIHYRIPKPFELGIVFGTVPERSYRLFAGHDGVGESVRSGVHAVTGTLAINPVPQLALPAAEVIANYDFFRKRPIESFSDEGLLPGARSSVHTSPIMVEVGEAIGVSPKKLEHLWNGYLGTLGGYALTTSDALLWAATSDVARPAMRVDDMIVLKSFVRTGVPWSTEFQEELYQYAKEAEQTYRTINEYLERGKEAKADALEQDNQALLNWRRDFRRATRDLADLRGDRDAVLLDPDMTAAVKRTQLDEIQRQINAIAKDTVEGFEAERRQ